MLRQVHIHIKNMLTTTPAINEFIHNENLFGGLIVTVILIWIITIITSFAAKAVSRDTKAIVPEYDPPKDISPGFARFFTSVW